MKTIIVLLSVLLSGHTLTDESGPRAVRVDGRQYALIGLESGLPMFRPITRWLVTNTYSALVPVPAQYGRVYVCIGRDSSGSQKAFTLDFRPDSSISMSEVILTNLNLADTLRGHHDFQLLSTQSTLYPFECQIVLSHAEFMFRWSESPEVEDTPGGIPTPLPSAIEMGKDFPRVQVGMLTNGRPVSASKSGRICVLNWWWTRCSPCIEELPSLNRLVSKYRGKVDFVAVTNDSKAEVMRFLKSRQFEYTQTLADSSVSSLFGKAAPRNIVVNRRGIVVFDLTGAGPATAKSIEAVIQRELGR